jgi:hypothetical protein
VVASPLHDDPFEKLVLVGDPRGLLGFVEDHLDAFAGIFVEA